MKKGIDLWGNVFTTEQMNDKTRQYCQMVAEVYEVPPSGVIAMAGQPYLDKDARLFLLNGFVAEKKIPQVKEFRTEYYQVSLEPDKMAVCRAIIILEDERFYDAVGEASRSNVKLEAVKNTLNMMAETRAMNRVIWKIVAGPTLERVMKNLKTMNVDKEDKDIIIDAGRVSAEEVNYDDAAKKMTEKMFTKIKNSIEKNLPTMSEKEKDEMASKIEKSEGVYTKEQKEKLMDTIYAG